MGSRLVFRDQRKTPQATWVGRNVLILVFASLSLVKINLVWLRLLVGYIGTMPQIIQLITGTLRPNEFPTKGSLLDMLPRIPTLLSGCYGYYREISPAKTTCTPTYSGGTGLVAPVGHRAKLVRQSGLQGLQVVLAGIRT